MSIVFRSSNPFTRIAEFFFVNRPIGVMKRTGQSMQTAGKQLSARSPSSKASAEMPKKATGSVPFSLRLDMLVLSIRLKTSNKESVLSALKIDIKQVKKNGVTKCSPAAVEMLDAMLVQLAARRQAIKVKHELPLAKGPVYRGF